MDGAFVAFATVLHLCGFNVSQLQFVITSFVLASLATPSSYQKFSISYVGCVEPPSRFSLRLVRVFPSQVVWHGSRADVVSQLCLT